MKRVFLFLATNMAIVLVLSVSMRLLGVEPYLNANGLNLTSLLIFAAVMGFGGSFISLAISKWSAKRAMGVQVIETPTNSTESWLLETVRTYSAKAGIKMPEVGIFDTPEVNAFATGMSRNSSLVAVSSGLLQQMSKREAEAVIGHEIAHVANGDMVTLALIQGVVNTFVMFLSRVIGHLVDRVVFKTERGHGPAFFVTMIVAELVLGVLASIIVMWFSRQREFHADRGGAALAGRQHMIAALERLNSLHPAPLPEKMAAFGISGGGGGGIKRLFMTHPPLAERIAALRSSAGHA
ncbi:MAG: Protease HtpX [Candidatus Accumulibacter regalis]|jgi:Heat shock protein. Metallo peptidase. MEROPS family M48B|uniref:Protease HtpX homolog n=1 Tax=Accumulibacter regalis TaxID=522306 RepID=A0A011QNS1_ACCRE|nr:MULTISPECIES: protease HtpX [unclassified Candidatus Accumulibacter]EXI90735.1 MAG: Protease HtpX [Candidatus Accumulibacter regalis]MQM34341.1 protease HtpX [Candidatus Accumulibacter phosphatis]MBL8367823.1 protease HtpX [Accumulibacter sp.]MBN8514471.1 protease HtpX [Accumulibacter sp.]MBO3702785.1 protease HtpX [Accumulibacter sp.]